MNISAFLSVDLMMKLHRQYVSSFFFKKTPSEKRPFINSNIDRVGWYWNLFTLFYDS